MTLIVRKFVLLSLILAIVFCIFVNVKPISNNCGMIIRRFGVRDRNGRRNNLLRKCLGSSTNDIISQSSQCNLESFQNNNVINTSLNSIGDTIKPDQGKIVDSLIKTELPKLFEKDTEVSDFLTYSFIQKY